MYTGKQVFAHLPISELCIYVSIRFTLGSSDQNIYFLESFMSSSLVRLASPIAVVAVLFLMLGRVTYFYLESDESLIGVIPDDAF
jgi:hypothetical protein